MVDRRDVRKLPALVAGIKIESGTLGAAPGRLPSFGGRRDLTLGAAGGPSRQNHNSEAKPKKVYTPNLNVQRNKNKLDLNSKDDHLNAKEKRDRHKNDGKGKKREKTNNLIQSTGVFAEGAAGKSKRYSSHGGGGGGGGDRESSNNFIPMPKLNLQHDRKIDKEEEEMKLKELLRDGFVDDPGMEPDTKNAPVILPMLSMAKVKCEVKNEAKAEVKKPKQIEIDGVKIKQEKLDEDEEKSKLENGTDTGLSTRKMKLPDQFSVHELLGSKEPELIFLQLPDCLPGLKPEVETGPVRPSTTAKPSTSASDQSTASDSTPNVVPPKQCTLSTLSEGCIGKLQVLKSGRTRLVLGNVVLHLDMGTQVGFREDLISVDLDHSSRGGDMINLGAIKTHLVCTPDWEAMLTKPVT